MKYLENLSNAIVQFEDSGFSSASAPPNDIFFADEEKGVEDLIIQIDNGEDVFLNDLTKNQIDALSDHYSGSEIRSCFTCSVLTDDWDLISEGYECGTCSKGNRTDYEDRKYGGHLGPFSSEEGSAPVMDPMELGEMANWTPMDGSPGLKRRRDAETYAAENQVFALTYFIENDIVMDDVNDVTEALELYLNLNGDILEMEELGLQKHPRYETANRLLSDLSYRLDELQTQTPNIIPNFELDAEYDAWRSAFTDGAAATQINKYQRGWMQKVMNPRSRQIKSMWNDAKPSFNEELKSAEMTALDRMGFRRSYGKPISALLAVGIGYLIYRKL